MITAAATELAAARKEVKFVELSTTHHFVPLAFESLGSIGSKATNFLKDLGRRLTLSTDNPIWKLHISVPAPVCSLAVL